MSGSPTSSTADRNLLFGVLALQMDFITRDGLVGAMNAWVLDKAKPLGQILAERGALRDDARLLLDALVQKHLEMHHDDPEQSLASVSSLGLVRDELQQIADADLRSSLASVSATRPPSQETPATRGDNRPSSNEGLAEADPFATRPPTVGTPTSSGLRFRILRPHAKGGLGQVSVALDEELGREVALKEIQGQYADDLGCRSRFLLEAEITGGLEHPGIVPVYSLGTYSGGRPYYAMRFIRGDSLQDAIRRFHDPEEASRDPGERALEFRQLLGRFVDVCNAIAYAHSRGVLHRDLKPGNIMLGQYGETLVVDWGLAKPVARAERATDSTEKTLRPGSASGLAPTQMGSALGTPQYMSPEQAAGRLDLLGPASDVYSLGATLYSLLTGKTPFEGNEVEAVLQSVQRGEFPPPRQVNGGVPAALEAICLKAMALRSENRYASAQALAGEVEHWLADEPVAAYREPWAVRAGRWARRHRTKVTAAVAAVAVAAVCLAAATVLLSAANQRERQAKNEATHQRDEVRKEKERADRNLAKARKAVENYCTNVANDERLEQGDFHSLRKKLLETAVPFYQELIEQTKDDPSLQADRGRAYGQLAFVREEMGETPAARAGYQEMRVIFAELARTFPAERGYRQCLALSHHSLGRVLWKSSGSLKLAEGEIRQAITIRERLVSDFPAVPAYRREVAQSYNYLGILLQARRQNKEAEAAYREAITLEEQLASDFPATPAHRHDLARSNNNLGILLKADGRDKEAEAAYRKAITLEEQLASDFPAAPAHRHDLARSNNNLGILLQAKRQNKEAEAAYRKAITLEEQLASDFPAAPAYRRDLARSNNNLGILLKAGGRDKEAEAAYRKAITLEEQLASDFPAAPAYRHELADSYDNLGDLLKAKGQHKEAEVAYRRAAASRETAPSGPAEGGGTFAGWGMSSLAEIPSGASR